MLVWEAKRKVETDKAAEMAYGGKQFFVVIYFYEERHSPRNTFLLIYTIIIRLRQTSAFGQLLSSDTSTEMSNVYHSVIRVVIDVVSSPCAVRAMDNIRVFLRFCSSAACFRPADAAWSAAPPQHRRRGQSGSEQSGRSCCVSPVADSWGALIRACGWSCTGTHAAEMGSQCVTLTRCLRCLWAWAQTASVSLWNLRNPGAHVEQLKSCRSVKL